MDSTISSKHSVKMDRVYRYQKHIYDFTRKYFLLGRDRLIADMNISPGSHILEMGCGTGRNLSLLHKKYKGNVHLYGIDASKEMLNIARKKLRHKKNSQVEYALAEEVNFKHTFSLSMPFDAVFFSYSLSMIPSWREALENAVQNLKEGGSVYIVDFYDQSKCPRWFKVLLKKWLKLFHVKHEPELIKFIQSSEFFQHPIHFEPMYGNYSFIARMEKK